METHPAIDWPAAQPWSFWVGDAGRWSIYAAIALCLLSFIFNLISGRKPNLARYATPTFVAGGLAFFVAFICLGVLFVRDQYQYTYVFAHSEADVELKYKVAAIWGGQEGSFLLWATCSALFGMLAMRVTAAYRRWFTIPYALFLASLGGILAYESPFNVQALDGKFLVPPTGQGLAPSLLNYWVTIHPPTIFLGFGSLTVLFCWAFAALVTKDYDSWIMRVRPWGIISLTLVGIGLCMGGFWAYETLGWGGFWMWDPVENVSFVPWVMAIAFVHGIFVQVAKKRWHLLNILLAGSTFLAFIYGTFLTRSGFLQDTSVHSFAKMNRTALWLLIGLGSVAILSFGGLWIWRSLQARKEAKQAAPAPEAKGIDRGSFFAAGIWLLTGLGVCCAFGMSVPFVMSLMGEKPKVVEEGLYHQVVSWLFIPLIILMACAPFIGWRKLGLGQVLLKVLNVFLISLGVVGLFMIWAKFPDIGARLDPEAKVKLLGREVAMGPWIFFLAWTCLFTITASIWRMVELWKRALPSLGAYLAHLGVAVAMLGLIVSRGFEQKAQIIVQDGRPAEGLGYRVSYRDPASPRDFNNRNNTVEFQVEGQREKFTAKPGYYMIEKPGQEPQTMVWPYIHGTPLYDVYFTLHPMTIEATDEVEFKPGETKLFEDTQITYESFKREGEAGLAGTKFIAKVKLKTPSGEATAEPAIVVGSGGGPDFQPARLGPDYIVSLNRLDAATRNVTLQLLYVQPLMPVEIFFKPLTILVWIGAGIMTLGGLISAWYRRIRKRTDAPETEVRADAPRHELDDAPAPVA